MAGSPVLNQSGPPEFVFRAFTTVPEFQALLFLLFLLLYLMILCGNTAIVWAVCTHSSLRTPMYFFLSNLSFLEIRASGLSVRHPARTGAPGSACGYSQL